MKSVTLLGALLALQTIPFLAEAAPAPYGVPECGPLSLENDTGATLIRDSEQCNLIWVLPPTAGTAKFSGFDDNANLGLCADLKNIQGDTIAISRQISASAQKLADLLPARQAADEAVAKAQSKVRELLQKAELSQLNSMQVEMEAISGRLEEVSTASLTCGDSCDTLRAEYRNLSAKRTLLNQDIRALRKGMLASVKEYDRAKAVETAAIAKRDAVLGGVNELRAEQNKFRIELQSMMKYYSTIGAGIAYVDYDMGWDDAIKRLSQRYPGTYEFRQVQTKDARVFANFVSQGGEETYLSSLPAILGYSLNGLKYLPYGEEKEPGLASLPSRLGGSVSLSMVGACPLYYKDFLDSAAFEKTGTDRKNYAFAISTTYQYPAVYKMKMTASYNLFKFYEKIVETSKKNGFFSSRTDVKTTENKIDRDAFNIDWAVEDPDSQYGEVKREEIASDLKKQLIGRVLGMMAQPQIQAPVQVVAPQEPGEHGAVVIAKGLESTCGGVNAWCTAGVWVLRGLDAVFGGSSAANKFNSTYNATATDTWTSKTVKWVPGATVFTPRQ